MHECVLPNVWHNLLAVGVAAAANFFLGAGWYSNALFSKIWVNALGRPIDPSRMGLAMGICVLTQLATAASLVAVTAALYSLRGSEAGDWLPTALTASLLAAVGFGLTEHGRTNAFGGNLRLFLVDGGYALAGYLLMGLVIGLLGSPLPK